MSPFLFDCRLESRQMPFFLADYAAFDYADFSAELSRRNAHTPDDVAARLYARYFIYYLFC